MGSSYTKTANCPVYRELPIDNTQPWVFAEYCFESQLALRLRVMDLENELFLLKQSLAASEPSPKHKIKPSKPSTFEACCQTSAPSDMEIEPNIILNPRRTIRCTSLRRRIFYTKVYTEKHIKREGMEIEKEKPADHPKKRIPHKSHKFVKIFVKKQVMEMEVQKASERKKPPRKKKSKHQGTPEELVRRKKRPKKNSPKKSLSGSELKILTPSRPKVSLITDFFDVIEKTKDCVKIKLAPDPT